MPLAKASITECVCMRVAECGYALALCSCVNFVYVHITCTYMLHACGCVHTHVAVCIHVCMWLYMCAHMCAHMGVSLCICECMCEHTSAHGCIKARERCQISCLITFCLIPLQQGLSLNWKPPVWIG